MPKETFHNLESSKKQRITQAFLIEFSEKIFEEASISQVVKELGIAKGSIYQYFEDKLNLFLYLKRHSEEVKLQYIHNLNRDDFDDFWEYYRAMYEQGVEFDLNHPLESKFLYALYKSETSPTVKEYLLEWKNQSVEIFKGIIQNEINAGNFRSDVNVETMAYFLVTSSMTVGDYMQRKFDLSLDENIRHGQPLFARQKKELIAVVDEFILLIKHAFSK